MDLNDLLITYKMITPDVPPTPKYTLPGLVRRETQEEIQPETKEIKKPQSYNWYYNPIQSQTITGTTAKKNSGLSFSEMIDKYGRGIVKVSNWNLRSPNASFGAKNSNHKKAHSTWKNPNGSPQPMAFDVTPVNGATFDDLRRLFTTKEWRDWFGQNNWGIIDEANGKKRSWRSTGAHLHLGPDTLALREYKDLLSRYQS